jgi:hypothetical protein
VFFHLLRGRADGAVEGAVADVVVTLIPLSEDWRLSCLGADDPILLHNGSVGRKDRPPKLLDDGLQAITHFSGS